MNPVLNQFQSGLNSGLLKHKGLNDICLHECGLSYNLFRMSSSPTLNLIFHYSLALHVFKIIFVE